MIKEANTQNLTETSTIIGDAVEAYNKKGNKVVTNARSCTPLTIAQIKTRVEPVEERFMLEGKELTDVCLIGIIRAITNQNVCMTYTIEDGTGSIDIKQWNRPDFQSDVTIQLDEAIAHHPCDIYVKVFGRLQTYFDRMLCVSQAIMPIENPNEIIFHFLDSIHVHLQSTMEKKSPSPTSTNMYKIGRNNINSIVKRAIKVCGDDEAGTHITSIISHLKHMFNETEVLKSLDELADEGQIYSLTDEYVQLVDL